MKCHRVNEVLELLQQQWLAEPDLNLIEWLTQRAAEAGCVNGLADLTDEVLIYQLKMRGTAQYAPIPGLQKDYEDDFKSALLQARGVIKK